MKVLRLELRAFGPFTDLALDFGEPGARLCLVYGDNEAGKSTALRAIHDLFYGIPETTRDAHLHKLADLRVAALVRDARDRELYVVRRKGRKDTLLDASGAPLPGPDASWLTAGVPESMFSSFFGLSYATLEQNAEALLSGSGDLGKSLFGAGVGGASVHQVLSALEREADELYRPRGKTQTLNAALSALEQAKARVREASVDPRIFEEQVQAIEASERLERELRAGRAERLAERSRLERARRVLPLLGERARLLRERAALGEVRLLPRDAAEQRAEAEESARTQALAIALLDAEIERLAAERAALQIPQSLVAIDAAFIDALRDRAGHHRHARAELPGQRQELLLLRTRTAARHGAAAEAAAEVAIDDRTVRSVREHALSRGSLESAVERGERLSASMQGELETERAQLVRLFDAHRARGSAQAPHASFAALPSRESADRFVEQFAALERELVAHREDELALQKDEERVARELGTLSQGAQLPTLPQLVALRAERRQAWLRLRAALDTGADTRALVAEVEELVARADDLGDKLRLDADRVAQHALLLAERESFARRRDLLAAAYAELEQRRAAAQADWHAAWKVSGVEPLAPEHMRGAVYEHHARRERIEALERELARHDGELRQQRAELERWRATWATLMGRVGLSPAASVADAEVQLSALAEAQAERARATALEQAIAQRERESAAFEVEVRALCAQHLDDARGLPVDEAASLIVQRHQRALLDASRRSEIDRHLRERGADREAASLRHAASQRRLAELCAAAGVAHVDQLRQAEERSDRARALDADIEKVSAALAHDSDGLTIAALEDEVRGANLDSLKARQVDVNREIEELEEEIERETHVLASRRAGRDQMQAGRGADEAAAQVAEQVTVVRDLGERYARLTLAAAVLRQEVARYRERHQGPVLRVASELFSRLTLAEFRGLAVDYDRADEPVLVCVRETGRDGESVPIAGLSSGTRDQLYLALRLASLCELATQQELLPLVLDDILVHFDDERARAAFAVLGEVAKLTQVLFFTHHARLRELAAESLPAERLSLHELPARRAARARTVA